MIDKEALKDFILKKIEPQGYFLVDLTVSPENDIVVLMDSAKGVDIDDCVALTKAVEGEFDRDAEDYALEVGSPSLTDPFKVKAQYLKHLGDEVEVLSGGKKYRGRLEEAGEESFTVVCQEKVKPEGAKRPVIEEVPHTFDYDKITYTKYILEF